MAVSERYKLLCWEILFDLVCTRSLQRKGTRQVEEHDALLISTVALVSCARLCTVHSSTQRMLSHITSATLSEDRPETLHYINSSPDDPRHANSCELSVLRMPSSQGQN